VNTKTQQTNGLKESSNKVRLVVNNLDKNFTMHLQNSAVIDIFSNLNLSVNEGACTVLSGPSGMGKSTLLKSLYGNYMITNGEIMLHCDDGMLDIAKASPQMIYALRRDVIGYVSQFLRVVPRVPALNIVMEPLLNRGVTKEVAQEKAKILLSRLNIPEALWSLSPTTFSGGEQQRINIARGFIAHYPILLLDEPTASLDAINRGVVIELIEEAKANGSAIVGIFHDESVRNVVADEVINLAECAQ
jgi:alpha-D-ribose 1-methylphosphonate 5-triphosphate synthase subunit PhnL